MESVASDSVGRWWGWWIWDWGTAGNFDARWRVDGRQGGVVIVAIVHFFVVRVIPVIPRSRAAAGFTSSMSSMGIRSGTRARHDAER